MLPLWYVSSGWYYPNRPEISETQLWRMLCVSPLPNLLAFGVESILDFNTARTHQPGAPISYNAEVVWRACSCGAMRRPSGCLGLTDHETGMSAYRSACDYPDNALRPDTSRIMIVTVLVLVILIARSGASIRY
jgi:hypothetical protein